MVEIDVGRFFSPRRKIFFPFRVESKDIHFVGSESDEILIKMIKIKGEIPEWRHNQIKTIFREKRANGNIYNKSGSVFTQETLNFF